MSTAPTISWEQYQKLPPAKRKRPLTPAEYAALTQAQREQPGLEEPNAGAPTDFGGPVFPNPDHIQPQLDTDSAPATRLPNGVSFQHQNFSGKTPADTSNPPAAQIIAPAMQTVGADMSVQPIDFSKYEQQAPAIDFSKYETGASSSSAEQQPSALSRLGHSFLSGLGVASDEDAKNFFEHPIHTAMSALNAQGELAVKARDAYNRGDYKSAVIHGLNYLVPFLGQQTDKAGEQLSQGDIAGGVGTTLGAAVPIVAGSPEVRAAAGDAASAAAGAVKPAMAKVGSAATAVGESLDPDLVGLASPRAAHALRLATKAGKVATKLGQEAPASEAAAATTPAPELTTEARTLPGQVGSDRIYGPRPAPAAPIAQRQGLMLGGKVESPDPQAAPAPENATAAQGSPSSPAAATPAKALEQQLSDALGGKKLVPGVSLKNQPAAMGAKLPEGFTPVESSVLKGYKYDPAAQHFEVITSDGARYGKMGITPDQVAAFEEADSKGRAWGVLKNSPGVISTKNGAPRAVPLSYRSATPEDVAPGETANQPAVKPRTIVTDPVTGRPEFSDAIAAKQNAGASEDLSGEWQAALDQIKAAKGNPTLETPSNPDLGNLGVERRTDVATRQKVAEMSPDEMRKTLLTSEKTGLPNRRAFDEAGPSPAVGMSDADGLKALNDKYGYEGGDALLKAKAQALQDAGLDAYHDKGDEFLYRAGSAEELQTKLEQARQALKEASITVRTPDGAVKTLKGADFSYGVGEGTDEAEQGLKSHKAQREARGERARGELRGITEQ